MVSVPENVKPQSEISNGALYRIPRLWILVLAFSYLLLPNILFLLEIYRPLYAIPLSIGLIISVIYCCNRCVKMWGECRRYVFFNTKDLIALVATLVIALIVAELIGFHGHVLQTDDMIYRNAMYQSLVDEKWPFFSNSGDLFVYYHAYWLPPALVAKIFRQVISPETILFFWYYLCFVTFILLAFSKLRGKVLLYFLFLVLLGNIVDVFEAAERFGKIVSGDEGMLVPSWLSWLMEDRGVMRFGGFWGNVLFTYNAGAPMIVVLIFLVSGILPLRFWYLPVSFSMSMTPIAAVALLPMLVCMFVTNRRVIWQVATSLSFYLCCMLVFLSVLYFTEFKKTGDYVTQICGLWEVQSFSSEAIKYIRYAVMSLGVLLSAFLLVKRRFRKNSLFTCIVVSASILPLIWIGRTDDLLTMKGGLVIFTLFAWLLVVQWNHSSKCRKIAIVCFVLLSSLHVCGFMLKQKVWEYSWDPEITKSNIADEWDGHMNHQDDYHYNNFFGEAKYPHIQYDKPGESIISILE